MPLIACAVRSQPKIFILSWAPCEFDGGDGADQRRLAGGVDHVEIGVAGHQVLGRRHRIVLDVATVDHARDRDAGRLLDLVLEALLAQVLDEGIEGTDDAELGLAAMRVDILDEVLADQAARLLVVDAHLALLRAGRQDRVDREDGDAGVGRFLDGRHDAVDVDRLDNDGADLLCYIGLDRVVLCCRIIVGVEDHELGAAGVGRLLGTLVHLVEEERLLVDRDQGDRRLIRRPGEPGQARRSQGRGGEHHSPCHRHFCVSHLVDHSRTPSSDRQRHDLGGGDEVGDRDGLVRLMRLRGIAGAEIDRGRGAETAGQAHVAVGP